MKEFVKILCYYLFINVFYMIKFKKLLNATFRNNDPSASIENTPLNIISFENLSSVD
jgi:hypothetical protein